MSRERILITSLINVASVVMGGNKDPMSVYAHTFTDESYEEIVHQKEENDEKATQMMSLAVFKAIAQKYEEGE